MARLQGSEGGDYVVAWSTICLPIQLGGISDLKKMMWALRMRWVWLQKTEPDCPLATLPIQAPAQVQAAFSITLKTEIGDGSRTKFWTDRWIHGQCILLIWLLLFAIIPKKRVQRCTVQEGLTNRTWITYL